MDTQDYLGDLKATLASSSLVVHIDIIQEYATPTQGFFRARLTLCNHDFLEVAEFFQRRQARIQTTEYRYQWMDAERRLLKKRWDNAPHYPNLPNFPDHVHISETGSIEPGQVLSILELIDLIQQELDA